MSARRAALALMAAVALAPRSATALPLALVPVDGHAWCGKAQGGPGVECPRDRGLRVEVGFDDSVPADLRRPERVTVLLDGLPVPDLPVSALGGGAYRVDLPRDGSPAARDAWARLLGDSVSGTRTVRVGLRFPNDVTAEQPEGDPRLRLVVLRHPLLELLLAAMVVLVLGTLLLARRTALLRDLPTLPRPGRQPCYSLARSQMAVWAVSCLAAFLFIWAVTGAIDTVSGSTLVLMGLGAGTALAATVVDRSKAGASLEERSKLRARVAEIDAALAATPAPAPADAALLGRERAAAARRIAELEDALAGPESQGFLLDVLSDERGVSLHRLQMVAWTLVVWCVFVGSVVHRLAMPQLNETLLGLMGVSAGTYLGFKIPEGT